MYELWLDSLGLLLEFLRRHPRLRLALALGCATLLLVCGTALWQLPHFGYFFTISQYQSIETFAQASSIMALVGLIVISGSFSRLKIRSRGLIGFELDTLEKERQTIQRRIARKRAPDVLDTIQLTLNQLNEYYTINKGQARGSFRISVVAVVVGFATLVSGIWMFYLKQTPNLQLSLVSAVSGVLLQFIGGAYFYLYRSSLEQLNVFFGQLVRMQDTMLSIRLAQEMPAAKRGEVTEKIIVNLLERSVSIPLRTHDHTPQRRHSDNSVVESDRQGPFEK